MKSWDMILVNGDSYSALSQKHRVYSEFMAEEMRVKCDNVARIGSNNDRIIRSTIEAVLHHVSRGQRPLLILGMSYISRQEVWAGDFEPDLLDISDTETRRLCNMLQESYPSVEHESQHLPTITLDWVGDQSRWKKQFRHQVEYEYFIHKRLLDNYVMLFLLTKFLQNLQVPYIVFSAADNLDIPVDTFPAMAHLQSVKSVLADPHVIEMHTNCIKLWAQVNDPDCDRISGHLSEHGHRLWAKRMIDLIGEHHGA